MMEGGASGNDEGDDYANRLGVVYPPIVFQHVSKDDHTLLRPIYCVMYALNAELRHNTRASPDFLPIAFDATIGEYTLVCQYENNFKFSYRLLQCLWSTNPARIRSMRLEPYLDTKSKKWLFRLILKVISLASAMIACDFAVHLRSDKTLLRPGFNSKTASELPVSTDAIRDETELIQKIKKICSTMVVFKSVVKDHQTTVKPIDECFETQRNDNNSATLRWHLPDYGGVDVATAAVLWAEVGTMVDDIAFGVLLDSTSKSGGGAVHLFVDIFLFSPVAPTLRLIDTKHQTYYSDPNKVDDPWKVEVTGPYHIQSASNHHEAKKSSAVASVAESIIMQPPSRKRLRSEKSLLLPPPQTPVSSPVSKKQKKRSDAADMDIVMPPSHPKPEKSLNDFNEKGPSSSSSSDSDSSSEESESSSKDTKERPAKRQKTQATQNTSMVSTLWSSLFSDNTTAVATPSTTKQKKSALASSSSSSSSDDGSEVKTSKKKRGKKSNGSSSHNKKKTAKKKKKKHQKVGANKSSSSSDS